MDEHGQASPYTIQPVPGKGLGVVATRNIPCGQRIIAEIPLFTIPRVAAANSVIADYTAAVDALSSDNQRAFFSLHNEKLEGDKTMGIIWTNAISIDPDTGGIFLQSSRFNHSCNSNAQYWWNETLKQMTIHAVRDIDVSDEITVCYRNPRQDRHARRQELQKLFGFVCACSLCSLTGHRQTESDERLNEVARLQKLFGDHLNVFRMPLRALRAVRKVLQLLKLEDIESGTVSWCYSQASLTAAMHGDLSRATVFGTRAAKLRALVAGEDCHVTVEYNNRVRNQSAQSGYGLSMRWKTSGEVPEGLTEGQFDQWLWRDGDEESASSRPGELADFGDNSIFPSFSGLPETHGIAFDGSGPSRRMTRGSWCFLAQVVEVNVPFPLRLIVKDRGGRLLPIHFHTAGRGIEFAASQPKPGDTIAILCAEQHNLQDGSTGIRVENPSLVKVGIDTFVQGLI
ncbi:hypothetical protein G7046_g8033 [Stylonectria norvegica]|nr:hypothetical protein G7046_g8033 [Stylonectria norvegica]